MEWLSLTNLLQIIVGLGLLNVWLVRGRSSTSYRGGAAQTLQEEFAAYGLPGFAFYVVGALKIGAAIVLIAGVWLSATRGPASPSFRLEQAQRKARVGVHPLLA